MNVDPSPEDRTILAALEELETGAGEPAPSGEATEAEADEEGHAAASTRAASRMANSAKVSRP